MIGNENHFYLFIYSVFLFYLDPDLRLHSMYYTYIFLVKIYL
jgi:hypothetical protein